MSFCSNDVTFRMSCLALYKVVILHLISATSRGNTIVLFDGSLIASSLHGQSLAGAVNGSLDLLMLEVKRGSVCGPFLVGAVAAWPAMN